MGVRTVLLLASMALVRESSPSPGNIVRVGELGAVYVLPAPPARRLRGDWELPGLLVISPTDEWAASAANIIRAVGDAEVAIATRAGASLSELAEWLAAEGLLSPRVRFLDTRLDTPWVRDFGPLEVAGADGLPIWLDARYDLERPLDDGLPEVLGASERVRVEPLPYAIDGGALASNGAGLCVITGASLESAGFDFEDFDNVAPLQETLGCHGLARVPALVGERTGHADISVQFLTPAMVAVARIAPSQSKINASLLDETAHAVRRAGALIGQNIDVIRVRMPVSGDGKTFFTYVNGIRLQAGFAVPSYSGVSAMDEQGAYADLRSVLGDVPLMPTPADAMIELAGAIHCVALGLSRGDRWHEGSRALR